MRGLGQRLGGGAIGHEEGVEGSQVSTRERFSLCTEPPHPRKTGSWLYLLSLSQKERESTPGHPIRNFRAQGRGKIRFSCQGEGLASFW